VAIEIDECSIENYKKYNILIDWYVGGIICGDLHIII
jgi:hypothetical protein